MSAQKGTKRKLADVRDIFTTDDPRKSGSKTPELKEEEEDILEEGEIEGGADPAKCKDYTVSGATIPLNDTEGGVAVSWLSNSPRHALCSIGYFEAANTDSGYMKTKKYVRYIPL